MYPSITLNANVQTSYSNARNQAETIGQSINGYNKIGIVEGTSNSVIAPVQSIQYRYFADRFSNQLSNNFSNGISIGITIPILNGGVARTNLLQAKLKVKSLELQHQQHNMELKQEIYKACTEIMTSLQKYNAAGKNQKATQKAFDFASKRYNMGLLNTLDLITTQNNLFAAKLQQLSAHYEYVFSLKVLELYKGQ